MSQKGLVREKVTKMAVEDLPEWDELPEVDPDATSKTGGTRERKPRPPDEMTDKMWLYAEKMAFIQCTGEEIACCLNMHYDTLLAHINRRGYASFSEWHKIHSAGGKMSLRRKQFKMAQESVPMAIWLGKQYLGQKEQTEANYSVHQMRLPTTDKLQQLVANDPAFKTDKIAATIKDVNKPTVILRKAETNEQKKEE